MSLASRISDLAAAVRDKINLMVPRLIPPGGTTGQIVTKIGAGNYLFGWADAPASGGGSGAIVTEVQVTFAQARAAGTFEVAVPGATVGQNVIATASASMPAGWSADELEADPLTVSGAVTATDVVTLIVTSIHGSPIGGPRNINLILG
jgi:hypothetical protein